MKLKVTVYALNDKGVSMGNKNYIYAVRDSATGKLITNLTNPGHKFWEKKGNCLNAIEAYNQATPRWRRHTYEGPLELVTFELVEVSNT
jgi:hypothetical protein